MNLSILYRGPLSSCNYACNYCPFAKHKESRAEHEADAQALERFVSWVEGRVDDQISILFTPWGEALVRKRYQEAMARLSHLPHLEKVAIQTNLSCRLDWIDSCDLSRLALWATYHPTQTRRERFLAKCAELSRRGVRYSVGVVGIKEHAEEIELLRRELPPQVYLWINAYKSRHDYYAPEMIERFTTLDPLFPLNTQNYRSRGRACRAGESVISVDGDGTMRRCHFIKQPIGNIYDPDFAAALQPRPCANQICNCHIGYVHMDELGLYDTFAGGVLERIPTQTVWPQLAAQDGGEIGR